MQNAGMEYLNSRLMFGMVPGLESTRKLCEALGNPQKKFKSIHVVGTNGKGSTSFYLAGILQAHGFKTGLFTSPHLVSLRERIRVNDEPIGEADLDRLLLQVKAAADKVNAEVAGAAGESPVEPTFFEVLTLVAFLYYAEQGLDVAVLEAGMGGRLDSTAVAEGELTVLTSIGLEHTEVLGATESAILKEKMAVGGKAYVVGGLSDALLEDAREFAARHSAKILEPKIRDDVSLPNLGQHYVENASLSLAAAKCFCDAVSELHCAVGMPYDDALAVRTLAKRSWAGRMQLLTDASGKVRYILDGAHNSHAVRRLVQTLDRYYPNVKFHCVFGALKDKDVDEMLKLMAPHVSHWHITKTPYPRFRELDDLRSQLAALGLTVASEGLLCREYLDEVLASSTAADAATSSAAAVDAFPGDKRPGESKEHPPVLITGSLYMIGETVQALKQDFDGLAFFRGLSPTTNEHR